MIEFKIKGIEYKIDEITIKDYYKIQNLLVVEGINAKIEIVSYLSGCTINDLKLLDKYQFLQLWNTVAEGPLNSSNDTKFWKHFIHNDKLYGFLDIANITLGEFADMDMLRHDPKSQQLLHKMMAIIYRPATMITEKWIVVDEYDSSKLDQRAEEFLDLPLKYVTSAISFFLQIAKCSLSNMLNSLMQEMQTEEEKEIVEMTNQIMLELLEDGTTQFSSVQEKILPKLTKLQELAQLVSLISLPIKSNEPKKKESVWNKIISKIKIK